MADTVRRVDYYYVTVPDKPGEGERILSAVKESEIKLLAYLGFPSGGGESQVDLVPEDPASFRRAAERAGLARSDANRPFLIGGDDAAGAVTNTAATLAGLDREITAAAAPR